AAIRNLIFGYDVFISYAHGDHTVPFARRLQSRLTDRDFVVFRDESHLLGGDQLTFVIRLAIRRTRGLVLRGDDAATESEWVAKEIRLFRERRKTVVAIDLDGVRERGAWGKLAEELGDTLTIDDHRGGPLETTMDRIADTRRGRRVNQWARMT